jgi:hypothetical protein
MINWQGCGIKQSWPNLTHYLGILPEGNEGNHEKPQLGYWVSGPIFELRSSRTRSRSDNHSTMTFDSNVLSNSSGINKRNC